MYIQENEERMPGTDFFSAVDGASGKILICPTAGKKISNAYAYNGNIAGKGLGELGEPTTLALTADSDVDGNIMNSPSDVSLRHVNKAIISFVDGHVDYTNNTISVVFFDDNTLMDDLIHNTGSNPRVHDNGGFTSYGWGTDGARVDYTPSGTPPTYTQDQSYLYYNSTTKEMTAISNHGNHVVYQLPADNFKNADGNAPTEWWGFSFDFRFESGSSGDLAKKAGTAMIDVVDGNGNPGKVLCRLYILLWNWGNSGVNLYLGGNGYNGYQLANPAASKAIFKVGQASAVWSDASAVATIHSAAYGHVSQNQKYSFVVDKNGDATFSYGKDSISANIGAVDFTNPPRVRAAHNGQGGKQIMTNLAFGCR